MTDKPNLAAQKAARRAIKGVGPDTDIAGNPLTEEQKATRREVEARWAKEDAARANAARLLDGVTRYNRIGQQMEQSPDGRWLHRLEVLAALSAAMPSDVAGVVEEAGKAAERLEKADPFQFPFSAADAELDAASTIRALISLATAQAAQIAGLQTDKEALIAVRDMLGGYWNKATARAEAAETALAAERAKVAKLVEALREVVTALHDAEKTLTEELHHMDFCGESAPLCNARAALSEAEARDD